VQSHQYFKNHSITEISKFDGGRESLRWVAGTVTNAAEGRDSLVAFANDRFGVPIALAEPRSVVDATPLSAEDDQR
jgi:hypothetical protein